MTGVSCFFCQNLLSDWMDGLLPSVRHDEINEHLKQCTICQKAQANLVLAREICQQKAPHDLSHELALHIMEASQHTRRMLPNRRQILKGGASLALVVVVSLGINSIFPELFPWFARIRPGINEAQFVRYFPLIQGADEVIDEQASWLNMKDPLNRSVWEEGGLSPEEFEKSFQGKVGSGKELDGPKIDN